MRFIGQYIQSLIARFRDDVYLEGISTGTIASGSNLGLDSNNKIVKATVSSDVDFSGLSSATPVHGDALVALDSDGSTEQLTEIRDLATLFAGSGLTATNSVIAVDSDINTTGSAGSLSATLAVGSGGTGQTSVQAAINALAGATTAGRFLRGNGSNVVLSAIQNSDIGTLNQDTTGSAATLTNAREFRTNLGSTSTASFDGSANVSPGVTGTLAVGNGGTGNADGNATGLVASTSNSIGVGSIELGHADDTTIARSAAGKMTVEGKEVRTVDRNIQIVHSSFRDDIGTSAHFIPWHSTSEKTTNTNEEIPFVAPYAGKLLELHYRTSKNTSGATATWELVQIEKTETVNTGNNDTLDTQTCTGPTNAASGAGNLVKVTFDSDAAFNAGDMLALKITHDSDVTDSNTKFYITTIWEYDLSSM